MPAGPPWRANATALSLGAAHRDVADGDLHGGADRRTPATRARLAAGGADPCDKIAGKIRFWGSGAIAPHSRENEMAARRPSPHSLAYRS